MFLFVVGDEVTANSRHFSSSSKYGERSISGKRRKWADCKTHSLWTGICCEVGKFSMALIGL